MDWRQILWIFFIAMVALVFVGGMYKFNDIKEVNKELADAKDIALALNQAGASKGEVNLIFNDMSGVSIDDNYVQVGRFTYSYIRGDKQIVLNEKDGKVVINVRRS